MTSILALPEDEAAGAWDGLDVMFATRSGGVRRNKLSDFVQINRNGKIAMKLDAETFPGGDSIVGVSLCTSADDVLLSTSNGRAIRFAADDVRVFMSRDSTGVRGIRLAEGDRSAVDGHPARGRRHAGRASGLSQARQRHARGGNR